MFAVIRDYVCIAGWGITGLIAAIILPTSIFGYRRILREEAGLAVPKKPMPLEESPLSYKRLRNSFRRYGITILALFLWMVCFQAACIFLITLQGQDLFQTNCGLPGWELFLRSFGMQYMFVGLLCLIMFYALHRHFLAMAKNEESFAATPAVVTQDTPFRERVFIEWLVSFGLFIAAGLHGLIFFVFIAGLIPRSSVTLFASLILLLAVTIGAAVLNVRLPILRWLVKPIAVVLIVGYLYISAIMLVKSSGTAGWTYLPFHDFFDSAQSYPVLFVLMVLSAVIFFAMATSMILGVFYLRSKTTGRFFSRRTITLIFGVQIAAVLGVYAFLYVPARVACLAEILVCRFRDDWTTHHNAKMSALASEIIRSTSETDRRYGWVHGVRGEMNLRERKYDEAIADFEVAFRSSRLSFHNYILCSEARIAKGDLSGALNDLDEALRLEKNLHEFHYNRGFINEQLGNIEEAIADYDKTIAWSKQFQKKPPIVSAVPRPGYDDESRRMVHEKRRYGYVITFEELVEIRDRLAAGTEKIP